MLLGSGSRIGKKLKAERLKEFAETRLVRRYDGNHPDAAERVKRFRRMKDQRLTVQRLKQLIGVSKPGRTTCRKEDADRLLDRDHGRKPRKRSAT